MVISEKPHFEHACQTWKALIGAAYGSHVASLEIQSRLIPFRQQRQNSPAITLEVAGARAIGVDSNRGSCRALAIVQCV
jgi:hypothetical protein